MSWNYLHGAAEWALMVGLVFGAGAIAHAEDESDGSVVQIGRSDKPERPNLPPGVPGDEDDQSRPAPPKFWIGLLGGTIPADNPLRADIDLPEKQGLLVANIVPKSPAEKAGLKPIGTQFSVEKKKVIYYLLSSYVLLFWSVNRPASSRSKQKCRRRAAHQSANSRPTGPLRTPRKPRL